MENKANNGFKLFLFRKRRFHWFCYDLSWDWFFFFFFLHLNWEVKQYPNINYSLKISELLTDMWFLFKLRKKLFRNIFKLVYNNGANKITISPLHRERQSTNKKTEKMIATCFHFLSKNNNAKKNKKIKKLLRTLLI